ncbi:MAG TPA: hypothetical protein VGI39_11290 [Polyangiaceae bacterium]|jgi:hypothetical protein
MNRQGAWLAVAVLALLALRWVSAPPWPDDWDGIGFVESIAHFDLAHFTPHPPGYPVYVAMLKLVGALVRDPIQAANVVAVACGVAASALVAVAASKALGSTARGAWVGAFVAFAPLAWRVGAAIGSEAPAFLFLAGALAAAAVGGRRAAWALGACVGLGLGVRLSWAPLFLALPLLLRGGRARLASVAVAAAFTAAWAVPLLAVVGPEDFVRLTLVHARGHFHVWGGTVLRDPGAARAAYLARDVFVDGLGVDADVLGVALGAVAVVVALLGLRAWRAHGWPYAKRGLVLLPYAVWIAFGQNLREQPRHALPLVVALAGALALGAMTSRPARIAGVLLLALVAARTVLDARARRATPPPGAQLVALAGTLLPDPSQVAVFGGPSARFFEILAPDLHAVTVGSLADARLALGRMRALPARVILTSELEGLERAGPALVPIASLCRPPRLERRAPCLTAYDWRLPFLSGPNSR